MHLIQVILFVIVILIGFYVYRKFRNSILDIILFFSFLLLGIVFIALPDITTRIAKFLGVGRGADLIFYLAILFFAFVCLKLYERIRKLEQMLHKAVRERAMEEGEEK